MTGPSSRAIVGFHGKLPGAGDFVQRRLPGAFVEAWDRAWQALLARMSERIGDVWRERFAAMPPWRFVLASSVCGPQAWVGAFLPSSDSVGRVFPLVIAAPLAADDGGWPALPGAAWFAAAERRLREGRCGGTPATFEAAVNTLTDPASMSAGWRAPRGGDMRGLWWRGDDPVVGTWLPGLPDDIDQLRSGAAYA